MYRERVSIITELDLDLESLMEGGRLHHRGCSLSPESREVSLILSPNLTDFLAPTGALLAPTGALWLEHFTLTPISANVFF